MRSADFQSPLRANRSEGRLTLSVFVRLKEGNRSKEPLPVPAGGGDLWHFILSLNESDWRNGGEQSLQDSEEKWAQTAPGA